MTSSASPPPYVPQAIFAPEESSAPVPRVLIAPNRYVQGDGILDHVGRYLSLVPSKRAALLISRRRQQRDGVRLQQSLRDAAIESVVVTFAGECSVEDVDRYVATLRAETAPVDCLIAAGGGKCVDAGKCVAYRLGIPVVVCPTLASNDAPCSALSVVYTPSGVFSDVESFPSNPALVAVDTRIVAEAPARYLVAGMGDAMATWYEARTCLESPHARTMVAARPTLAATAIGETCASTLYANGLAAAKAVERSEVNEALERVVEANTLLSGIGFESGGLAIAHSIAQGLTVVPEVHRSCLHGEMVAIGLIAQLVAEKETEEATKAAEFFAAVGLPVHLGQVSLSPRDTAELDAVVRAAMTLPFVHNEPFEVSPERLHADMLQAHELGVRVAETAGDAAYRALRAD